MIITVPAAIVGDDIVGVTHYHAWCFVCAVCQGEFLKDGKVHESDIQMFIE